MKYLITVLVGAAAITAAVTTAIAQAHRAFNGDVSLTPYLYGYGAAALLLLLALVMAIDASRQESKRVPPPPAVHQENKQTVTQEFHFGASSSPRTVTSELDETAKRIVEFMKTTHPHSAYKADEIATGLNLTKPHTSEKLKNIGPESGVRPIKTDQETLWMFDDPEL